MIIEPPIRYDHPYTGPIIEIVMKAPDVDRYCRTKGKFDEGFQVIGCAWRNNGVCFTVISQHAYEPIKRHEIAHCNGWSGDHLK